MPNGRQRWQAFGLWTGVLQSFENVNLIVRFGDVKSSLDYLLKNGNDRGLKFKLFFFLNFIILLDIFGAGQRGDLIQKYLFQN